MTTTTTVPRRHRRDNRQATRNRDEQLDVLARQVEIERAQLPTPSARERVPWRDRERLPVARPVMTNPKDEIGWFLGHVRNRAGHHGCRLDLHARTFWRSVGRGTHRGCCWLRDYVKMPARQEVLIRAIAAGETDKHARLSASYEKRKKLRKQRLAGGLGAVAVGLLVVLAILGPRLTPLALFLLGPPALAVYGRRRNSKANPAMQIDTRPIPKSDPRPTADLIFQAFEHSGINGIVVETAPHRVGSGWETVARIPMGTQTFKDAVKAHAKIAGNLGIGSECLALAPIKGTGGSEKHVRVWHTKTDPFAGDPPPHPFLDPKSGPADLWNDGLPIGIDQRGSEIRISMVDTPFVNAVGRPGSGKSFLFLDILTGVASDPLWDLDCWSFKASDDFSPAKPLVKACGGTYRCGTEEATFKAFYDYLVRLRALCVERNEAQGRLPIERRSKLKVEREVAADPDLVPSMRPRAVPVDEIITALEHRTWGPKILKELEEGGRTFRSQNIVFILGSQFADSEIYKNLQKLLGSRICLSVARWQDSAGALGGDHDPDLADASTIPLTAKGVAFVAGSIDDPALGQRPTVKGRTYGNDLTWVEAHIARCLATHRAGQSPRISLVKTDDPFRTNLAAALADGPVGVAVLARALGFGEGTGNVRRFTDAARSAGIEPRTETRDAGGVVARGAKYIHPEQLDTH